MNEVILISGMALVTFAVRYPILALLGKIRLPEPVFRALRFVPPVVLTAIIVSAVLFSAENHIDIGLSNAYLVAALVAVVVACRSKNLLLTIVLGMLALWGWRWLIGFLG
jgi:branched-subunit amino acid transport protein